MATAGRQCRLWAKVNEWVLDLLNGRDRYHLRSGDQVQMSGLTIRLQTDPSTKGLGDDPAMLGIMNDVINGLLADVPPAAQASRFADERNEAGRRKAG